ncbi:MAG: pyruvate formate lyase family protein [Desulfobacterales bacterium]|nr:pyruvate formate lyase family protein [Desulfobacterales bacterium]
MVVKTVRNTQRGFVEEESDRGAYRPDVRLAIERSRLITESYKMTEGEPWVIRRAKALEHILRKMTIYIEDNDLIVGNATESPNHLVHFIDNNCESVRRLINDKAGWTLADDAGKAEFEELCKYWTGKNMRDRHDQFFTDEMKNDFKYDGTFLWSVWSEPEVPNHEKVFRIGLKGIRGQAEQKLAELEEKYPVDFLQQKEFIDAVIITLDAAMHFAGRFADRARSLAQCESDEERKKELLKIAATCDRVPANPARTLQEAIQSFWFIHLITHQIDFINYGIGVRMDVLFNPFYLRDKEAGRLTREGAQELFECLWLKFEGLGQMYTPLLAGVYAGAQLIQSTTIGGVDSEGKDVTNEISYIILDVVKSVRTLEGSLALRFHKDSPKEFIMKAIDVVACGLGYPAFFNDEVLVSLLVKQGLSLKDARDFTIRACVYINIPGKCIGKIGLGYLSLPKVLWWALHGGISPKTGKQRGAPTQDPATFTSIDGVMKAYLAQLRFFNKKHVQMHNLSCAIHKEYLPRPFLSAVMDDCIEQGKDCRAWAIPGYRDFNIMLGPTNVADSLAVLKKVVFEDKIIPMKEFIEVLDSNWENKEAFRQMILNKVPKFGNDDDYVDDLAIAVQYNTKAVMEEFTDAFGRPYSGDGSGSSSTYGLAIMCEATPDGRKDGEPFADATLSPSAGADRKGPLAVLSSAGKIDSLRSYNQLLNQKFMPQFLEGENKETFYNYLRTWHDLGISHVQFNVVDKAVLLDAKEHPEKHSDLIVRIAGYSAYFVDLSAGLQDNIIERTEQGF